VAAGEPPGLWYGKGAAALGLVGEVDAEMMKALYTHGLDPTDPATASRKTWHEAARFGNAPHRLICLCSSCHLVTHFGHATVTGRTHEALMHLRGVTGMSEERAWAHIDATGDLWQERSYRVWRLDLSMLTNAGVTLRDPESAADRADTADRALSQIRRAGGQLRTIDGHTGSDFRRLLRIVSGSLNRFVLVAFRRSRQSVNSIEFVLKGRINVCDVDSYDR